jgi:thiamine biosynthesis lipoprotein
VSRLDELLDANGTTLRIVLDDGEAGEEPSLLVRGAAQRVRKALDAAARAVDKQLPELNADPRAIVPASPELRRLVAAGRRAAERTGGLVDFTVRDALEALGDGEPGDYAAALREAPRRRPATPDPRARWRTVDVQGSAIRRLAGVRIDGGAVGRGLAADLAVAAAGQAVRARVTCGEDTVVSGGARQVWAHHPLNDEPCHPFTVTGGLATSSIARGIWRRPDGRWAHHVLDPGSGEPAWTGLLAVSALGADGVEADALATAALLSGPLVARRVLRPHGGLLVHENGDVELVGPRRRNPVRALRRRPPGSAA